MPHHDAVDVPEDLFWVNYGFEVSLMEAAEKAKLKAAAERNASAEHTQEDVESDSPERAPAVDNDDDAGQEVGCARVCCTRK